MERVINTLPSHRMGGSLVLVSHPPPPGCCNSARIDRFTHTHPSSSPTSANMATTDQPRSKSWSDDEAAPAPEMMDDDQHAVAVKPQTTMITASALPLSMVLVQAFTMVMLFLSKLALNTGMRPFVLLVYRNLIAAVAVAPLALIFERYVRTAGTKFITHLAKSCSCVLHQYVIAHLTQLGRR
jgi:hypothetical protein